MPPARSGSRPACGSSPGCCRSSRSSSTSAPTSTCWRGNAPNSAGTGSGISPCVRHVSWRCLRRPCWWCGSFSGPSSETVFNVDWIGRGVLLVVSPLWFVAAYLALILLMPITVWLHQKFDMLILVVFGGLAIVVDILRFRYGVPYVEWVNMLFVWGFSFQLGYFHRRISGLDQRHHRPDGSVDWGYQSDRSRQLALVMTFTGLFALVGLVFSGLYPGSMVGVPGQGSNMAPPTVCIIALTVFQVGVAELIRPVVLRALRHGGVFARVMGVITRFALPLFLFHTTGMALSRGLEWAIFGTRIEATTPTWNWWLLRPVAIVFPLICTLPVIWFFYVPAPTPRAKTRVASGLSGPDSCSADPVSGHRLAEPGHEGGQQGFAERPRAVAAGRVDVPDLSGIDRRYGPPSGRAVALRPRTCTGRTGCTRADLDPTGVRPRRRRRWGPDQRGMPRRADRGAPPGTPRRRGPHSAPATPRRPGNQDCAPPGPRPPGAALTPWVIGRQPVGEVRLVP